MGRELVNAVSEILLVILDTTFSFALYSKLVGKYSSWSSPKLRYDRPRCRLRSQYFPAFGRSVESCRLGMWAGAVLSNFCLDLLLILREFNN